MCAPRNESAPAALRHSVPVCYIFPRKREHRSAQGIWRKQAVWVNTLDGVREASGPLFPVIC